MYSMILNGQKNTLAEYMILSGADNGPPMLDKDLYDSWKSRMELYMQNREHGRMILESVEHGPLIWPTIEENRVTKTKKYVELSATEKIQADCDLKATNIILQGLPSDIYSLINHHRVAKDLWEKIDFGLAVLVFKHGDDPIDAINKMMSFVSTIVTSRFPSTNNQLRNSSNPRQQATIHDGRVTVPPLQGRQNSYTAGKGKVMNEEELEFLADPSIVEGPVTQSVITHNSTYQADDLDTYDSNCDEISTAKAVLMANLSSYGSDVLSEVPYSDNTHNDMLNQSVQEIPYSEQTNLVNYPEIEITSVSNIIPYSQYLLETQNEVVQDTNSSTQQDAMILSVFEQLSSQVTNCNKVNEDNLIANETLYAKLERYKEQVKLLERQNVDLGSREKLIIDDINRDKDAQKKKLGILIKKLLWKRKLKNWTCIMESCDPVDTPMVEKSKLDEDPQGKAIDPTYYHGMVGTLMFLTSSRPDLVYAVSFADADHAGCQDTIRNTSGSMQLLGDRLVSWSSKRQKSTAISSTEAKYIALSGCCAQHIDIRYHFIKEQVENGVVELYFVSTEYQLADIFTKALCRERIEFLIDKLGMRSFTPETLKELADEAEE
ncbi:hypothetical protein Tco_0894415 [Tanacetum coccineum]|uniref:Reverse transcriptase Ty1/copia-type domain-containing protein n=1 Tax=Tanacetum coccineum TaxID=301880 RepID=A0ABQ5CEV4_9ASTR